MSPLRSVGARLSVALALVVLLALGAAYAIVVPPLERGLIDSKLDQLAQSADAVDLPPAVAFAFGEPRREDVLQFVEGAAGATGARVAVFSSGTIGTPGVLRGESFGTPHVLADSFGEPQEVAKDPVALRATQSDELEQRGTVPRDGKLWAEVAVVRVATSGLLVVLFSAPLDDTLANVELVKRRVLVAGAVALVIVLLIGYGGAWLFARRIRGLERAAERIAGGRLDEPVVDRGADELGQLARAFERMRGRLAQLEHARREFIANASHELRTPIFSLGGFLELLDDEDLDERTRAEFLGAMREQVDRLTRLATDLLDLSRLDAGRIHVEPEAVDLGRLAHDLADEFAALAHAGGHPLAADVRGQPPYALGDELQILRIGRVLVENALRHTPPGTPVAIDVRSKADGVELAVEDRGPGIPAEHLPHVFERFYRVDGGMASGSGLGLAIARELAVVMRGALTVESRPGRTVFRLRLPAAAELARGAADGAPVAAGR